MAEILILDDSTLDPTLEGSEVPVFIDLWAEWCMPCRKIAPVIQELADEYDGKMVFGKLNVDENPASARKYQVMSIPMFLILYKGDVLESFIGALPKGKFVEKVESALRKL